MTEQNPFKKRVLDVINLEWKKHKEEITLTA